jgi:hypothetical protein
MTEQRDSIFISYAWKDDQPFVERLYNDPQRLGYDPWMDTKNMPNRGRPYIRFTHACMPDSTELELILQAYPRDNEIARVRRTKN